MTSRLAMGAGDAIKPDWRGAPVWANFLAQDGDGEWYWFECRPVPLKGQWRAKDGQSLLAGTSYVPVGPMEPRP
jgi:hypothetical protein